MTDKAGVSTSTPDSCFADCFRRPPTSSQTSDADPFIVCAIPDHPGDLDPRTIEAAYEDDAHYLGILPAEYHLDIEQRELTKHPPAVDQVNDLLATLGFAPVQPFTEIAWTNRHEQLVVLVVAQQSRLSIEQCDHGLRQTITRRPFRGPVAHPGNPDAREGHTDLEQCTHCGALRVVNVGPTEAPHHLTLSWSELYRVLVGPHQRQEQR